MFNDIFKFYFFKQLVHLLYACYIKNSLKQKAYGSAFVLLKSSFIYVTFLVKGFDAANMIPPLHCDLAANTAK